MDVLDDLAILSGRERLEYLVDLGKSLPACSSCRSDSFRVPGCTSLVYVRLFGSSESVSVEGFAASSVVSGMLAVLFDVLSNRSVEFVLSSEVEELLSSAGLTDSSVVSRSFALGNVLSHIRSQAMQL